MGHHTCCNFWSPLVSQPAGLTVSTDMSTTSTQGVLMSTLWSESWNQNICLSGFSHWVMHGLFGASIKNSTIGFSFNFWGWYQKRKMTAHHQCENCFKQPSLFIRSEKRCKCWISPLWCSEVMWVDEHVYILVHICWTALFFRKNRSKISHDLSNRTEHAWAIIGAASNKHTKYNRTPTSTIQFFLFSTCTIF